MKNRFDEQLELLHTELIEMGALIENVIGNTSKALVQQSVKEAKKAIAFGKETDVKERDIEGLYLRLLLKQQPVAKDLRFIFGRA